MADDSQRSAVRWGVAALLVGAGAVLVFVIVAAVGLLQHGQRFFDLAGDLFVSEETEVRTPAVVIRELREASELTTAEFAMEAITSAKRNRSIGPFQVGETKLLYVAYGEVRAGVELSELAPDDIEVSEDGKEVTVRLPPPKVLGATLDLDRSHVYDVEKSLFGPADIDLQSEAERRALRKIEASACDSGVLEHANDNAETVVQELLGSAGFERVHVETASPPEGACPEMPPMQRK